MVYVVYLCTNSIFTPPTARNLPFFLESAYNSYISLVWLAGYVRTCHGSHLQTPSKLTVVLKFDILKADELSLKHNHHFNALLFSSSLTGHIPCSSFGVLWVIFTVLSWSLTGHMHCSSPGLLRVTYTALLLVSYRSHALLLSWSLTGHMHCSSPGLLCVTYNAPLLVSYRSRRLVLMGSYMSHVLFFS